MPVEVITAENFQATACQNQSLFQTGRGDVDIDGIKTITLEKLVELKLASGMTAADRLKDLADVQELIKIKDLTAEFADRLDDYVRPKYIELYERGRTRPTTRDEELEKVLTKKDIFGRLPISPSPAGCSWSISRQRHGRRGG